MSGAYAKRLLNEGRLIERDREQLAQDGIYVVFTKEDSYETGLFLIEGPPDSVYRYGWYLFSFVFPSDFPLHPPKVRFLSNEMNPVE